MLDHNDIGPDDWILALIQGGVRSGGALEGQRYLGVERKVREQFRGPNVGSLQGEKGDYRSHLSRRRYRGIWKLDPGFLQV